MELVVYLLVLWAIMFPLRLFCTRFGSSRRGLFLVFLVVVGVTRHFDVPGRWMEAVERPERAKRFRRKLKRVSRTRSRQARRERRTQKFFDCAKKPGTIR